jgi:hypothetical protein
MNINMIYEFYRPDEYNGPCKAARCMSRSPTFPVNETCQEEQSQVFTHQEALSTCRPPQRLNILNPSDPLP